jgi:hypothetical protein
MLTLTRPWEFLSFTDDDPSRNDSAIEDDSANDSEASSAASNADKPLSAPPTRQSDGRKIRFSTWEEAFNYIQEWAKHHGYGVKLGRHKRRGKKPGGPIRKRWVHCTTAGEKQGTHVADTFRKRTNTHSGACKCPFTMTTQEYAGDWIIQVVVNRHTCTPSSDPSGLKDPDVARQIFHKFSANNTAKKVYDELLSM